MTSRVLICGTFAAPTHLATGVGSLSVVTADYNKDGHEDIAVGNARAIEQAWDSLAKGGLCVVIGLPPTGSRVSIDAGGIPGTERRLAGSFYGSARTYTDFPRLVDLYLAGHLKIDELITNRYDISETNEAFRALAAGEVARGLIVF